MRLFIDESLSPQLARWLNDTGMHDAVHPLHIGWRGRHDHTILSRCLAEDRIVVTQNRRDFLRLLLQVEIHPGLIVLPSVPRNESWAHLVTALAFLAQKGDAANAMVNHVLEIAADGTISLAPLPP